MSNFLQKICNFFEEYGMRRAVEEMRKHEAYRRTYNELIKLTDKELQDIGISRGMIHSVALEALLDNYQVRSRTGAA